MNRHHVPVDESRVANTVISAEQRDASTDAHERFKALVESKLRAKACYDAVLDSLR